MSEAKNAANFCGLIEIAHTLPAKGEVGVGIFREEASWS
jgi:hypothetical protein